MTTPAPASSLVFTRVGLHLGALRPRVEALGEVREWPEGARLCEQGGTDRVLHVVLAGEVAYPQGWLGSGAHAGELAFLLGVPRTVDLVARVPTRTWSVDAAALEADPEAATELIAALVRELPTRLRKFVPDLPPESEYCDHGHTAIRTLARALHGSDDAATAARIWSFVRDLPYRFGPWWLKASDTLRAGWGMCTTKSNLEVALFRAAGLEGGFVEMHIDARFLEPLLPPSWHHCVHRVSRHYMGAVMFDGRWHVAECSFTEPALRELEKLFPQLKSYPVRTLAPGQPYHPVSCMMGTDPFDETIVGSITHAMARRSSFDLDQLELLNLVNDAIQPTVVDEPAWLIRARALQSVDPLRAMHMALAAAAVIAADLHGKIVETA